MAECHDRQFTVVFAIDGSEQAKNAVNYYLKHLHQESNRVVLCFVVELPDDAHARQENLYPATLQQLWTDAAGKAHSMEEKYVQMFQARQVTQIKVRTERGLKPGQVVVQVAEAEKANLVVMGTRGLGTVRRTLLGSVSDYVIHHAHCPVVVCRGDTS